MLAGQAAGAQVRFLDDEEDKPMPPLNYTPTPRDVASYIGNCIGHCSQSATVSYRFALFLPNRVVLSERDFRPMWLAVRHNDGTQRMVLNIDQVRVDAGEILIAFRPSDCVWTQPTMSRSSMVLGIDHATARFYYNRRLRRGESCL